ncbi:hypothetical protein V5O48_007272 [Marasmius crinis-equi]|uniref:Nudix hydrolase domain-containing protein n=1 Tax=Marasmius crinis-equi TaxID=585013 RepID=A0ABR3FHM2_9AGAR
MVLTNQICSSVRFSARQYSEIDSALNRSPHPLNRRAAVLALLYEQEGDLRVLLTTRSKELRTHAGQTALPGGRVDAVDSSVIEAAFREANEEVDLPLNSPSIHTICTLEPFFSLHMLVVTTVVALLTDVSVLGNLKPSENEVSRIFSHPLEALLNPELVRNDPLALPGSEDWIYEPELHHTSDSAHGKLNMYRNHRFRSVGSPIKGLTSDILIKVAEIAYARKTEYERYAPGQIHGYDALTKFLQQLDHQTANQTTAH